MSLAAASTDPYVLLMEGELQTLRNANQRLREEIAGLHAVLEARPKRAVEPLTEWQETLRRRDLEIAALRAGLFPNVRRMTINGAP